MLIIQVCVIGFSGLVARAKLCVNLNIGFICAFTSHMPSVPDCPVKTNDVVVGL